MRVALYCARKNNETFNVDALGLNYIAAYCADESYNIEIEIFDSIDEIIKFRPSILGISSVTQTINDARKCARDVKLSLGNITTVLGGYHITTFKKLPPEFDYGITGEGERSFKTLILKKIGKRLSKKKVINGVYTPFSELPFPIHNKLYSDKFPIFTSRGCPYSCKFCASSVMWKNEIEFRTAWDVVDEIEYNYSKFNFRQLYILDDLWIADAARLKDIQRELTTRNLVGKFSIFGFVRSNLINEDNIQILKSIGYKNPRFGLETGSNRLLREMKGNNISVENHQRVIDLSQKYKMKACGSLMFGYPGETEDDINKTINFLDKNRGKFSIHGFYFFNPIPGTAIWNELKLSTSSDYSGMQLDLLNGFDWNKARNYYYNPRLDFDKFKNIIQKIIKEFIK